MICLDIKNNSPAANSSMKDKPLITTTRPAVTHKDSNNDCHVYNFRNFSVHTIVTISRNSGQINC